MNVMSVTRSDTSIINALRQKGYKATSQRIAICRIALVSREHPNAQRIYRNVKRLHPTVSLATVYKTLQVLSKLGMIQELAFPNAETRFDSNVKAHVNVICLQCGSIRDINEQALRDDVLKAVSRTKFTATAERFDVYGICEKCSRKKGSVAQNKLSLP
jgi:Fur family peroxide stress response transcriptional regulator